MAAIARPILEALSLATGESSHFAIRSGDDIVVLARTAGSGAFQLMDRVGAVRPAHCTALGKILLAALDESQLEGLLARRPPAPFTARTITDREVLTAEIAAVRRNGIAYDDSEFNAEARCVAVPVRDFTGEIRGAIGISGAVWRLSLQALEEKARLVREAAGRMEAAFGCDPGRGSGEVDGAVQRPRRPALR